MRPGPRPDLFSYLSYRDYLRDWFDARKAADRRFSHRLFARRAGVRSPSFFNEVVAGRRNLSPRVLEGFVAALDLDAESADFFTALVHFDQADVHDDKNVAWERLAASRRFRNARPIEGPLVAYLSNWYVPAIRELALRSDFDADPQWISRTLTPRITEAQARGAVDTLLDLGLLAHDGERLRPVDVSLATSHEVAGLAAHNYHHQMLDRAKGAITGARPQERHLLGVTVCIPEGLVPRLKQELDAFQERLLELCDAHVDTAERVYQLQLSLFPLSRSDR